MDSYTEPGALRLLGCKVLQTRGVSGGRSCRARSVVVAREGDLIEPGAGWPYRARGIHIFARVVGLIELRVSDLLDW